MGSIKENPLFSNLIQVKGDEDAELDYLEGLINAQELKILEFEEGMKKSLEVIEHSTMQMGQKMEEITEKMEKRLENFEARMDDKLNLLLQILGIDKTIQEVMAEEFPQWEKNDMGGTDERITNIEMVVVAPYANKEEGNSFLDSQENLDVGKNVDLNDDGDELLDLNDKTGEFLNFHGSFLLLEDCVGKNLFAKKLQEADHFGVALSTLTNSTSSFNDLLDHGISREAKEINLVSLKFEIQSQKIHQSWAELVTKFKGGTFLVIYGMMKAERKLYLDYFEYVQGYESEHELELSGLTMSLAFTVYCIAIRYKEINSAHNKDLCYIELAVEVIEFDVFISPKYETAKEGPFTLCFMFLCLKNI